MLGKTLGGLGLLTVTVAVDAFGLVTMLPWVRRSLALDAPRFWSGVWLLIRVAWCLIAFHLIEIAVWAAFFWWQDCLPDFGSALYFSGPPTRPSVMATCCSRRSCGFLHRSRGSRES